MSNLPISSRYRSQPDTPVSEAERDQVSARLNAAFAAGTLGQDDYDARLDRLFAAARLGDLVPVVDGLPPAQTYSEPTNITTGGAAGDLNQAHRGSALTLVVVATLVAVVVLIALLVVWLV